MVKHLSWCASAVVSYTKIIKQPATLLEKPWHLFSATFLHFLNIFIEKNYFEQIRFLKRSSSHKTGSRYFFVQESKHHSDLLR